MLVEGTHGAPSVLARAENGLREPGKRSQSCAGPIAPQEDFCPHPVSAASAALLVQPEMASFGLRVHCTQNRKPRCLHEGADRARIWALGLLFLGGCMDGDLVAASPGDLLPVCKSRHGLPEAAGAITWSQPLLVMGNHGLELPQLSTEPPALPSRAGTHSRNSRDATPCPEPQLNRAAAPEGL